VGRDGGGRIGEASASEEYLLKVDPAENVHLRGIKRTYLRGKINKDPPQRAKHCLLMQNSFF
jgi:hypothetical protein